jgi:hypothetical protein
MAISKLIPLEEVEQIKLSAWLTKNNIRHTASANGAKRSMQSAMKLKRMGLSPGFPDIEIPIPSGDYHGCYIEMKRTQGGKLSSQQSEWLEFLTGQGYYAVCAKGFDEAKEIVTHYLAFGKPAA